MRQGVPTNVNSTQSNRLTLALKRQEVSSETVQWRGDKAMATIVWLSLGWPRFHTLECTADAAHVCSNYQQILQVATAR